MEHRLQPYLASGRLVALLEDWSQPFPGFFAYYRKQRFTPPALKVLLASLRGSQQRRAGPAS